MQVSQTGCMLYFPYVQMTVISFVEILNLD